MTKATFEFSCLVQADRPTFRGRSYPEHVLRAMIDAFVPVPAYAGRTSFDACVDVDVKIGEAVALRLDDDLNLRVAIRFDDGGRWAREAIRKEFKVRFSFDCMGETCVLDGEEVVVRTDAPTSFRKNACTPEFMAWVRRKIESESRAS